MSRLNDFQTKSNQELLRLYCDLMEELRERQLVTSNNPVPDFADALRMYLLYAPEKVLYGTDAAPYPSIPGGADVQHLMLSRATRDALYLALAGLVRDGVINEDGAVEIGRGVLRENARRLYGWK